MPLIPGLSSADPLHIETLWFCSFCFSSHRGIRPMSLRTATLAWIEEILQKLRMCCLYSRVKDVEGFSWIRHIMYEQRLLNSIWAPGWIFQRETWAPGVWKSDHLGWSPVLTLLLCKGTLTNASTQTKSHFYHTQISHLVCTHIPSQSWRTCWASLFLTGDRKTFIPQKTPRFRQAR